MKYLKSALKISAVAVGVILFLIIAIKVVAGVVIGCLLSNLATSMGLDLTTALFVFFAGFFLLIGAGYKSFRLRNIKWVIRFICIFTAFFFGIKILLHNRQPIEKWIDTKKAASAAITESNRVMAVELKRLSDEREYNLKMAEIKVKEKASEISAVYSSIHPAPVNLIFPPQRTDNTTTVNINQNYNIPLSQAPPLKIFHRVVGLGGKLGPQKAKEMCLWDIQGWNCVIVSENYTHSVEEIPGTSMLPSVDTCELIVKQIDSP